MGTQCSATEQSKCCTVINIWMKTSGRCDYELTGKVQLNPVHGGRKVNGKINPQVFINSFLQLLFTNTNLISCFNTLKLGWLCNIFKLSTEQYAIKYCIVINILTLKMNWRCDYALKGKVQRNRVHGWCQVYGKNKTLNIDPKSL